MPPLTPQQNTAIQNANQNATVNANAITTPPAQPNLPVTQPPQAPTPTPFDITQYITPPQQQDNSQLEQQTQSVFEQLLGAQQQAATQGARLTAMEQQAGVPQLTTDLADIQNQISQKDLAFRREREAIQNETLTAAQKNARLADVSRKQASELADLEVVRAARSNSLNAIQSIIDRKVQREFADEGRRIENLKFIYDSVKGDLTKAQDRQYQQMISRENRAFELAKSKYEQVENAKGELVKNAQLNGANTATLQKIMAAKDLAGAYAAAGNFGLSIEDKLKRAQLAKALAETSGIPAAQKAKVENLANVAQLISELKTAQGFAGAVGAGFQKFIPGFLKGGSQFIAGTKPAGYQATFNQLKDTLALSNIDKLKGSMSDKDLEFLRNTATKLSLGMSEEDFLKELDKMSQTVSGQLKTYGIDTSLFDVQNVDNETFLSAPTQQTGNSNFFKVK